MERRPGPLRQGVSRRMVAGGGFKGGQVVGASDAKGEEVKDRPVYPGDLIGSMYELLGIDPERQAAAPAGPASPADAGRQRRREVGGAAEGDHVTQAVTCRRRPSRDAGSGVSGPSGQPCRLLRCAAARVGRDTLE